MKSAVKELEVHECACVFKIELAWMQGSVGEYVSKVYQYDPPGSVYKVRLLLCFCTSAIVVLAILISLTICRAPGQSAVLSSNCEVSPRLS